jgi:D-sedoheptulose 7-phosphate isomerase
MRNVILSTIEESIAVKRELAENLVPDIERFARFFVDTLRNGNKLLVCGNGGSAADSQHIACELVNRFLVERRPLPAIALSTDTSILTSIANDYSYDQVFKKQVEALGLPGDLLLAISTSGKAANVNEAVKAAREKGLKTIALTGKGGGDLAPLVDMALIIPGKDTPRIQESHLTVIHIFCDIIERELFA